MKTTARCCAMAERVGERVAPKVGERMVEGDFGISTMSEPLRLHLLLHLTLSATFFFVFTLFLVTWRAFLLQLTNFDFHICRQVATRLF